MPLLGKIDCVKNVARREVAYALATVEPLAVVRPQGVKAKIFYTAYQGNIYGIAVPVESPIKRFADLKGKKIGVISMPSTGEIIARALAVANEMNPDTDITVVVAGEGAQPRHCCARTKSTRSANGTRNMRRSRTQALSSGCCPPGRSNASRGTVSWLSRRHCATGVGRQWRLPKATRRGR